MVHGAEVDGAPIGVLPGAAAQDVQEGGPHVLVPQRVDDGVGEGVALSQDQAVLLVAEHLTRDAAQAVQQQDHQARRPAEDEAACPEREVGGVIRCVWISSKIPRLKRELLREKEQRFKECLAGGRRKNGNVL